MKKRFFILGLLSLVFTGCQTLTDTKETQALLFDFYPKILSITLADDNIPVILWKNPTIATRLVEGAEIYIKSPKDSAYPDLPNCTVSTNATHFSSRALFEDGFGEYKFKMKVVDKDGAPGLFSEEFTINFSGFHKTVGLITTFGEGDTLNQPMAMVQDSQGNLYIADTGNSRVVKLDSNGQFVESYGSKGSTLGKFKYPLGITMDSAGHVFVSDTGNDRMVCFDPEDFEGTVRTLGRFGNTLGRFNQPAGCYVIADKLFVCDVNNNFIQVITLTNASDIWTDTDVSILVGTAPYKSLSSLSSSLTQVYVVDKGAHSIIVFNTSGVVVDTIGSRGQDEGELLDPRALTYDSFRDQIYVANHGNDSIDVFEQDGTFVERWGVEGTEPGELSSPVAITTFNGRAYVLERESSRIQIFKL